MVQNEDFTTNMLRMICGTLFYSASLQTAREMYGRATSPWVLVRRLL
jgi:hypothetical protein